MYVIHQAQLELLHIFARLLTFYKLLPRFEEIFERNDMLVGMSELNATHISKSTPPPEASSAVTENKSRVLGLVRGLSNLAETP
jgi:endonuclease IV